MGFASCVIISSYMKYRGLGYFEEKVPFYSVDEFQGRFRLKGTTFEVLVRQVMESNQMEQ